MTTEDDWGGGEGQGGIQEKVEGGGEGEKAEQENGMLGAIHEIQLISKAFWYPSKLFEINSIWNVLKLLKIHDTKEKSIFLSSWIHILALLKYNWQIQW